MSSVQDLVGLGMPPDLARREGLTLGAITAAGSSSTTATALGGTTLANVTASGGADGVILPSDAPLGRPYIVFNAGATTVNVFPPSLGTINGGTATTGSVTVAQNKVRIFWRYNSTIWISILTA